MIKASVTPSTYTSGNIPLTMVANTNTKYALKNNTIDVMASGITEVKANVTITAPTAGLVTLTAYADGNAIASASVTAVADGTYTLNINDVIRTAYVPTNSYVGVNFALSTTCTIVSGDAICEYIYA